MTKDQHAAIVAAGGARECFDHDLYGRFDVTAMRMAVDTGVAEKIMVPIYAFIDYVKEKRIACPDRVNNLTEAQWRGDPGLGFDTPDGFFMVDGTHRSLRREKEGCTHMEFWRFPYELMSAFQPLPGMVDLAKIDSRFDWGTPL